MDPNHNHKSKRQLDDSQWQNPQQQQWIDEASRLMADIALARTEMYNFDQSGLGGYDGFDERTLLVMDEIAEALPRAFPPGWFNEVMAKAKRLSRRQAKPATPNAALSKSQLADRQHNQDLHDKHRGYWLGAGKLVTQKIARYLAQREGQNPAVTEAYLPEIANAVASRLAQFLPADKQLRVLHDHLRPKASGRSMSRKAQLKLRPPKGGSSA